MSKFVLDASAILALLNQESGAEEAASLLDQASVSAVNLAEVAVRLSDRGVPLADVRQTLGVLALPLECLPLAGIDITDHQSGAEKILAQLRERRR